MGKKVVQSGPKRSKLVQDGQNERTSSHVFNEFKSWQKKSRSEQKWTAEGKSGSKRSIEDKSGEKWTKIGKKGHFCK